MAVALANYHLVSGLKLNLLFSHQAGKDDKTEKEETYIKDLQTEVNALGLKEQVTFDSRDEEIIIYGLRAISKFIEA